jgi:hypothetical protein
MRNGFFVEDPLFPGLFDSFDGCSGILPTRFKALYGTRIRTYLELGIQ